MRGAQQQQPAWIDSIQRLSLPDQLTSRLRQAIIHGALPPGTRLLENDLAAKFSVSRTTLREAFRTLQMEGLVEAQPNRGCFVTRITRQDLHEIYSLRALLEGYAVEIVTRQASDPEIEALEALVQQTLAAANAGDFARATELDFSWHQKIWELSNHQRLYQILNSMSSQIRLYLTINAKLHKELIESVTDHPQIMAAIRRRDGRSAVPLIQRHICEARRILEEFALKQKRNEA